MVIAINDAYQMAPWATYQYWCDAKWWAWHKDRADFQAFEGQRICYECVDQPDVLNIDGDSGRKGISFDPNMINFGSNSGFHALNIAVLMGAKRILLLGYDMKFSRDGRSHWFGDHPDGVRSSYMSWLTNFGLAADQLKEKGIEVINCSPDTALTCFKMESLESALSSEPALASAMSK